ncbi:hypothetical protein [Mesomycoplasma molare]|uniref:Uncharacterized protein n=1 Tax=Mesomycoplasma molare TaxID=171288 RepID=A0ABY5TUY6_9BACT|nr:hypothetical protein [Mesomycoplasma molare]UWD34154.1 hypothetical protein NX772_03660 [Mesomycoplasma molare]
MENKNNSFLESIINFLNSFSNTNPNIWVPILFVFLIGLSFLIGFFFKLKITIAKIISLILTIVTSIILFDVIKSNLKKEYENVLSLAITIISLIIYWIIRIIVISIVFTFSLFGKKKRKEKFKRKNKVTKLILRSIYGVSNVALTIPGSLLFSNVLLTSSEKETSFSESSKSGVYIMTGGRGQGIETLLGSLKDSFENLTENAQKVVEIFSKNSSEWSEEEKKIVKDMFKNASKLINDKRIQQIVFPFIEDNFKKLNIEQSLEEVVDKAIDRLKIDKPEYNLSSPEKQKEIATNYLKEEINKLYEEAKITNPNLEQEVENIVALTSNLNKETIEKITNFVSPLITNEDINNKIDINTSINTLLTFFKSKNQNNITN